MKSPIEKLLTVLGVPTEQRKSRYCCPLHTRDSFTLVFLKNTILPGGYHVKCDDLKCGFDGTVFCLLEKALGCPASEAQSMFLHDGKLHDTFCPTTHNRGHDRAVVEDHMMTLGLDKSVKEYLLKCKKGFLSSSPLRASLTSFGVQESVLDGLSIGKYDKVLPDELMPGAPSVGKDDMLICPYTCGNLVTGMTVLNPDTGVSRDLTVSSEGENHGIFQEHAMGDGKVIYVCPDELTAVLAYSKFLEFTNEPSGTVCLKTPEALANVPDAKTICLVSTPENILPFHSAANYWMRYRGSRELTVVELPKRMSNFRGLSLKSVLGASVSIDQWLVDHLAKVNHKKGPPEVTKVVSSVGFKKKDKNDLMKLLKEAGHDDPLFLTAVRNAKLAGSIMKYGSQTVRRNSASYADVSKGGNRKISNFVFYADTVTKDDKGNRIVVGRIRTDNSADPLINAAFPTKALLNPHGAKLTEMAWGAAKDQDVDFKPWAGELGSGLTWFNVLIGFDNPSRHDSVSDLGARADGMLNFPQVRIDTTAKALHPGGFLHNVDPLVAASYGEITVTKGGNEGALKVLLESKNPMAIRLCLVLGHMAHQTVCPVVLGNKYVPKHLGLPYTVNTEISYNVLSLVGCALGGSPRPTLLPTQAAEFSSIIKANKQLETLPATYVTREPNNSRALDWMYSSRNSIVIGVPAHDLGKLGREDYIYFLYDEEEELGYKYLLGNEFLESIQSVWPFLMMSGVDKVAPGIDLSPDVVPALRGREWMAEEVGAKLPKVDCEISDYYAPVKQHGLELFGTIMSERVQYGDVLMAKGRAQYREGGAKYIGYTDTHYAAFNTKRSMAFMESIGIPFNSKFLRREAYSKGYLRSRSQEDIPIFLEVWEEYCRPKRGEVLTKADLKIVRAS